MKTKFAVAWAALRRDAVGVSGAAMLSYGCWLAWRPLGFIVGGALLVLANYFIARGGPEG